MNSAIALTLTLFITLAIGMPLVGWVMSRQPQDKLVRLWFLIIVFDGLQLPFVAAQIKYPGWLTFVIPTVITIMFYTTVLNLLRLELKPTAFPWKKVFIAGLSYVFVATFIFEYINYSPLLIYTLNNLLYLALALWVGYGALVVARQQRSLSMYFVSLGFFIGACGYVMRAYSHLVLQTSTPVFEFSTTSNVLVVTQIVNMILMCFGYLGYVRDKAEDEKIVLTRKATEAKTQEEISKKYAQELECLVQERDHMVMMNSRFLNLSALAVFNSAIVHEISQPLAALTMSLDNLKNKDQDTGNHLQEEVAESIALTNKAGDIVHALRGMMAMERGGIERIDVLAQARAICPIIEGDARLQGIKFGSSIPNGSIFCDCNGVLFQRLIINLVANAFDAFKSANTLSPELSMAVSSRVINDEEMVVFAVEDNGPGLSDDELDALFKPFDTQKPGNFGIGLSLADILLRKWQGRIYARHREIGSGVVFEMTLPVCPPPSLFRE